MKLKWRFVWKHRSALEWYTERNGAVLRAELKSIARDGKGERAWFAWIEGKKKVDCGRHDFLMIAQRAAEEGYGKNF